MKLVSIFILTILVTGTAYAQKAPQLHTSAILTGQVAAQATAEPTAKSSGMTLRDAAAKRNFYIGTAVAYGALISAKDYSDLVKREFNMIVPENVMKWDAIEPIKGTFTFGQGDKLVAFAEANGMKVRGHTLLWHQQLPGWLTSKTYTRDELLAILKNHITELAGHYKGRIVAWDVVNEAIGDHGGMRKDFWLDTIGPDYIEQAFRFAHDAAPDAKLFYNDYNSEGMGVKSNDIYKLVKDLKEKGVPIDGVGLQMHIGIGFRESPDLKELAANMERLEALGLEVQITEMDVKIQNGDGTDEEKLAAQAKVYGDILQVCLDHKNCTAFMVWGLTDKYSWIPGFTGKPDAPLLFDKSYLPKPSYQSVLDTLVKSATN